jgi:hypothetical protein
VVSVTDSQGRILGFLDRSHYFFLSSSSSVVLTRMSNVSVSNICIEICLDIQVLDLFGALKFKY